MSKNKITTCSYFLKRLRDSGYIVNKIFSEYSEGDPRTWTAMVDPGNTSLYVTCYNNFEEIGEVFFEIYDGGQYVPDKFKIRTSSIEVVIEYLVKFGIHNKSTSYVGS